MNKYVFDRLEFYITNVCNLTCNGCNRYNNYKFSGFWPWAEAEPVLRAWAEKIDVRHPVILGGEPLLHPDIVNWITGLRKIFPNYSGVQVQSNGTQGVYQDRGSVIQFTLTYVSGARTDGDYTTSNPQSVQGGPGESGGANYGNYWYFNDTTNITINHQVQVVYPETTNLSNSWGTVTVS